MTDNQWQTPEGKLLGDAIAHDGRSARQIAPEIGVSDTRLRHIVNGYQPVGRGQKIPAISPASTLARAAQVLGVTADQLTAAGRDDAAELLRSAPPRVEVAEDDPLDVVMARLAGVEDRLAWIEEQLLGPGQHLEAVAKVEPLETHTDFPDT